jgi:hypothetical protein
MDNAGIIVEADEWASAAGECSYTLHIESKAWAEDISWSIDAGKADEVGSGEAKYSDYTSYDTEIKMKPGMHQLVVKGNEQYREGWNSGTYTISQKFGDHSIVVRNTAFGISSPSFNEYGGPINDQEQGFRGVVSFNTIGCGAVAAAEAAAPMPVADDARDAKIAADAAAATAPVMHGTAVKVVAPLTGPCGTDAAGALQIQLEVRTENWSSDISWNVDGGTEDSTHGGPLSLNQHSYFYNMNLEPGAHTLNMFDEMGDTWNAMDLTPTSHGYGNTATL